MHDVKEFSNKVLIIEKFQQFSVYYKISLGARDVKEILQGAFVYKKVKKHLFKLQHRALSYVTGVHS